MMNRFIIKSIAYVCVIAVGALLLDMMITHGLCAVESYTIKPWMDIRNGNMEHDILIMGNSRAQDHIHPAILDSILGMSSYNLGTEAHHSDLHILKYHYYIHHNKKPKYIIYQVDLATFHPTKLKYSANNEQFLPFFDDEYLRNEFAKYDYDKIDISLPLVRYFGNHTAIWWGLSKSLGLAKIDHLPEYKGFRMHKNDGSVVDTTGIFDIERIDMSNSFSIQDSCLVRFENFLDESIADSIKLIFVYTPMYSTVMSQLSDKDEFDLYINDISQKYDIPYIDYTLDDEFCSNAKYFASPGHLNYDGACAITKRLACDIDSLGLLK